MKQVLKAMYESEAQSKEEVFQKLLDYSENNELDFDLRQLLGQVAHYIATDKVLNDGQYKQDIKWLSKALGEPCATRNLHLIYKAENGDLVATNTKVIHIIKSGGLTRDELICPLTGRSIGKDVNSGNFPEYQQAIVGVDAHQSPYNEFTLERSKHSASVGEHYYTYRVGGSDYGVLESQLKNSLSGMNKDTTVVRVGIDGRLQLECGNKMAIISPLRV